MTAWALLFSGAVAVSFAALACVQRSLYASAACLLVVLLQVSVFFYLSGAPLLAFLNLMIYAGAVMILIVIMVMASSPKGAPVWSELSLPRPLGLLFAVPVLEAAALIARGAPAAGAAGAGAGLEARLGTILFSSYAPATEAATLLMLVAGLALVVQERP